VAQSFEDVVLLVLAVLIAVLSFVAVVREQKSCGQVRTKPQT
jgi:hypothetical protein